LVMVEAKAAARTGCAGAAVSATQPDAHHRFRGAGGAGVQFQRLRCAAAAPLPDPGAGRYARPVEQAAPTARHRRGRGSDRARGLALHPGAVALAAPDSKLGRDPDLPEHPKNRPHCWTVRSRQAAHSGDSPTSIRSHLPPGILAARPVSLRQRCSWACQRLTEGVLNCRFLQQVQRRRVILGVATCKHRALSLQTSRFSAQIN